MKSKSIPSAFVLAVMAFAAFSAVAEVREKSVQTNPSVPVMTDPVALKAFVNHPGYCQVFVGINAEVDALTVDYSKALADLIPTQADADDVRNILASVKSSCQVRSLGVSN